MTEKDQTNYKILTLFIELETDFIADLLTELNSSDDEQKSYETNLFCFNIHYTEKQVTVKTTVPSIAESLDKNHLRISIEAVENYLRTNMKGTT